MSIFDAEIVETPPRNVRGRKVQFTEEYKKIAELLKTGKWSKVPNVQESQSNAMKQRIRGVAAKLEMAVTIQHDKDEESLYFQGKPKFKIKD